MSTGKTKTVVNTPKEKTESKPSISTEKEKANIPDAPENPIANHLATGIVSGITGAPTKPIKHKVDPEAKAPDISDEINTTVVNPVAPTIDNPAPEPIGRAVASPKAHEEPTFHTGEDYNRLKVAFLKALGHGTMDIDHQRSLKQEAGIL
jgi:hypothetical protein